MSKAFDGLLGLDSEKKFVATKEDKAEDKRASKASFELEKDRLV